MISDGIDITDIDARYLRQHIGLVSQEPVLFATTITESMNSFVYYIDTSTCPHIFFFIVDPSVCFNNIQWSYTRHQIRNREGRIAR